MSRPLPASALLLPAYSQPSDSELAQRVALVLDGGRASSVLTVADRIHEIMPSIDARAIALAVNLTTGRSGSAHGMRARYAAEGIDRTSSQAGIMRAAAHEELFYRSLYIVNAARRLEASLADDMSTPDAWAKERRNYLLHVAAREQRRKAVARTAVAAALFGATLGWYLNPLLNNDPECVAANGHNFKSDTIPSIGLPGTVHMNCGCYAGPPHENASSVNAATRSHVSAARKLTRKAS